MGREWTRPEGEGVERRRTNKLEGEENGDPAPRTGSRPRRPLGGNFAGEEGAGSHRPFRHLTFQPRNVKTWQEDPLPRHWVYGVCLIRDTSGKSCLPARCCHMCPMMRNSSIYYQPGVVLRTLQSILTAPP
ncbi:PREDICTED: uncharacterized protein LOC105580638 [Cercocebus atys]|uniref:uncharacterized protein LOC105580638 n=1 Tax=Cercocebus atys TaxID=9531 RepID=UPI0005F3A1B0|nr:PREDICTED: uncharacterized protein LOC105580638 [Cercocebus atys]